MRRITPRITATVLAATMSLLALPITASAQEMAPERCKATFTPAEVQAGQAAVRIDARLSSPIGEVNSLEAPESSGVATASADDLAKMKTEMARPTEEGQKVEPIEMSTDGQSATLWLNTEKAQKGTYQVVLKAEGAKSCIGQFTVKGGGDTSGY